MTLTNIFEKLSDYVFKIEKWIVMTLIIAMFVSLTAGVFFRYYLNSPLFWSDEFAIFTLVWLTFLGGSMSIKRQQTAAVTILVDKLNEKLRKLVASIGFFIVFLFCLFIVYYSFIWLSSPNIVLQKSNSMQIPMIYPYLSVPLGFFFMSIHSLHLFLLSLKETS
ncbi:TRAP transporter small permease [Halalkalibacter alkalisediminis]|uniref:TRAP transporter small permease n=1 Tax=Halalkalibacter alkalisediminis TaxID=935616 RepID=A0ABV6NFP2_9BACI|nr:TRAP transporter small permease [Halalkalibacter alkalisediminis]